MVHNSLENINGIARKMIPEMRYDGNGDFGEWQKIAKFKLKELLGLPICKCSDMFRMIVEKNKEEYKQIDFEFQSEENYFVKASILIPNEIQKPVPCVICLQGHSTGMHISLGEKIFDNDEESIAGGRDFAVQTVKNGYCAVAMEQRYMGTAGQDENGSPCCLSHNAAMAALLLGRTAIGERVHDVSTLIDVITEHFFDYVDVNNIICMGNSGGGTTTFYASCIDERISMSIPSCAVCTYEQSIMSMFHCPCNFIPNIRKYFDMGDLGGLIAPRNLIVVCGKEDRIFPVNGVKNSFDIIKKLYDTVNAKDNCQLIIGDKGHQFYADDIWPIVKMLMNK